MMVKIAIAIAALIVVVLVLAALKPDTFRLERSTMVQAGPERIFPSINDFHNWTAWSPFEKVDPDVKKTYSGPSSGKGAIYEWNGNSKVGQGRMEILDSVAPNKVTIKLDFLKPFEAHNVAEFTMTPKGSATEVKWAMVGPSPFMMKVMYVFVNMDKMLGKDFDSGLAAIKAIAEGK
jgi:hypothetical protein